MMLAFLVDIFGHFNKLNLSLQRRDVTISDVKDKLVGLSARMEVWQERLKADCTASFPLLHKHLEINKIKLTHNIKICMIKHLEIICAEFRFYSNNIPLPVS